MGGKSKSTNTTSLTTNTDNSNTQINDNEGTILNLDGAQNNEVSITETDHDAVASSFAFGESALDKVGDAFNKTLATVDNTTESAFDFGDSALKNALSFGVTALQGSNEFGRDVIHEAQEISKNALTVAGNAQTNAFSKIREIAESFTSDSQSMQRLMLIAAGAGVFGLGALYLLRRR